MFEAFLKFFAMGGHGGFIWPAWGIGVALMLVLTVLSIIKLRYANKRLEMKNIGKDGAHG